MAYVKVGPWGGCGGSPWTFKANGRISEIRISTGDLVDSIGQFTYTDQDGVKHVSERYGGPAGSPLTITFEDDEELTGISGLVGFYGKCGDVVDSIGVILRAIE